MPSFPPAAYVKSIEINDLFGESDIQIAAQPGSDPRVLILYGKNGTGKTTILKIVTGLLSSEQNGGHRTRLASLPFSRAVITLDGGVQVEAKKKDGLTGSYDWTVRRANGQHSVHIPVRSRSQGVRMSDWNADTRSRYEQMTSEISSLVPEVVFLDDKRTFRTEEEPRRKVRVVELGGMTREEVITTEEDPVHSGLETIANSIRREAILRSNRGNLSAQSIYTDVVKGVITFPQSKVPSEVSIKAQLSDLQEKSRRLSLYGLVPPAEHGELLAALDLANEQSLPLAQAVLNPYVQSLSARLSAIEALHSHLHTWVTDINEFISPKVLSFRVGEDIEIRKDHKTPIPVPLLSSGERHLLLLMTKAFLLRTKGGLMIVDEPELSLNSGWQRGLIRGLLDGFGGAPSQLIVASHSLEICSQYQNQVAVI